MKQQVIDILTDFKDSIDPPYDWSDYSKWVYEGKHEIVSDIIRHIQSLWDGWIPVLERLPENEQNVIWTFKNSIWNSRVIRCFYARKYEVEMWDDPWDFWEYNEEKDEYYLPEWWYESNEYEEINYKVSDEITHYQPLPLPPNQ